MKRLLVAGTAKTAKIRMANEWVAMEIQYCTYCSNYFINHENTNYILYVHKKLLILIYLYPTDTLVTFFSS